MCEIDFGESAELWSERNVRARKPHKCSCCGGSIKAGEMYIRHFSVGDGSPTSEKCCLPCDAMRDEFDKIHTACGTPGYMPELLRYCIDTERDAGNDAMVEKWQSELAQMAERKKAAA